MAWRPTHLVIEGELDNSIRDKVTGWIKFYGLEKNVIFDLKGNFHRDIRGAKIKFHSEEYMEQDEKEAIEYMKSFSLTQTGNAGDITLGLPTGKKENGELIYEYGSLPYFEFYSNENGRIVIELDAEQIELLTKPIPVVESDPIDRKEQNKNMADFMNSLVDGLKNEKNKCKKMK